MYFSLITKKSQKNQRQVNHLKTSKKFLEVFFIISPNTIKQKKLIFEISFLFYLMNTISFF